MMKIVCLSVYLAASVGAFGQQRPHALGARLENSEYFHGIGQFDQLSVQEKGVTPIPGREAVFEVPHPPPGDQKNQGSCVAWAVGYTFFSSYLQRHLTPVWNETTEISPAFVYHFVKWGGDCDAGSNIPRAMQLIEKIGACMWKSWPYNDTDCRSAPNTAQLTEAEKYRSPCGDPNATNDPPVEKAGRGDCDAHGAPIWVALHANSVDEYKTFLRTYNWPIVVAYNVNSSFDLMWARNGIWTVDTGKVRGGHCVCVIGWDDNKSFNGKTGMFKCQNQWGTNSGDHGFFWVSYDLIAAGVFPEAYGWVRDEHAHPAPVHRNPALQPKIHDRTHG
jgi:Papain family cysteine protease